MSAPSRDRWSLRRLLLALVAVGVAGIAVELILLGHTEDPTQLAPFAVMVPALAALASYGLAPARGTRNLLRATMLLLIASAGAGVYYHYRGNMEFQLELDPSLSGLALAEKVLHAKAPPALAPGHLALLGLFGLAATHRGLDLTERKEGA